jgi:hypothetical protein
MLTRLSVTLVVTTATLLLQGWGAEAAASICASGTVDEPAIPCELPFTSSCVELLSTGEVTTEDNLRDDATNGGCILCVPPGGKYVGPNPCPTCFCVEHELQCSALAGTYLSAQDGTAPCPDSEYANFTDYVVTMVGCAELSCGEAVPVLDTSGAKVAKGGSDKKKEKDKSQSDGKGKKKKEKKMKDKETKTKMTKGERK